MMVYKAVKACTKVGLAGGAVYWSVQQGVWGEPQEGAQAMKRFMATILPDDSSSPAPTPKPKAQKMVVTSGDGIIRSSWNKGAKTVFECIRDMPEHAGKATATVTNFVKDSFKS